MVDANRAIGRETLRLPPGQAELLRAEGKTLILRLYVDREASIDAEGDDERPLAEIDTAAARQFDSHLERRRAARPRRRPLPRRPADALMIEVGPSGDKLEWRFDRPY